MRFEARQVQRWLSRATLVFAALGGLYLWTRYEVLTLPSEGCSPLTRLAPGCVLWIDLRPGSLAPGDVVFFQLADGRLALAEVERREAGRLWLVIDEESCPGESSATLGWIPEEHVHGRMIFAARP